VPDVTVVGNAEDVVGALALIESLRPDLVVLDVGLRGKDRGIDVLKYVTREHPEIKVIAMSNFTWEAMRNSLLAAGALAYFDKGSEFMRARDWIANLTRGQSAAS
jgi:DNA-binding NarL/FixJ family response regulator